MPTFKLTFTETKSVAYSIEVEIEAETPAAAAELAEAAYEKGEYDTRLEEASGDTQKCETFIEYHAPDGAIEIF